MLQSSSSIVNVPENSRDLVNEPVLKYSKHSSLSSFSNGSSIDYTPDQLRFLLAQKKIDIPSQENQTRKPQRSFTQWMKSIDLSSGDGSDCSDRSRNSDWSMYLFYYGFVFFPFWYIGSFIGRSSRWRNRCRVASIFASIVVIILMITLPLVYLRR